MDQFGLVQPIDRLGQRVVMAVSFVLPTEGAMPASASLSLERMPTYYEPLFE